MRKERNEIGNTAVIVVQFVFVMLLVMMGLVTLSGCSVQQIPIQTVERIEYRDSLIFVHDTLRVEVPKEIVREVLPEIDTSILSTSLAESVAYLDTAERRIFHSLEQKGEVKVRVDTFYTTKIVEKIVEKEVAVEVEKKVKYIPEWCWYSVVFNIVVVLLIIFRIYLKKRV